MGYNKSVRLGLEELASGPISVMKLNLLHSRIHGLLRDTYGHKWVLLHHCNRTKPLPPGPLQLRSSCREVIWVIMAKCIALLGPNLPQRNVVKRETCECLTRRVQ